MPPKKAAPAPADNDGEKGFRWTPENEKKLLLLVTSFRPISPEEWNDIVTVFPGSNLNGVKIRTSRLRIQGRELRFEHGLEDEEDKKALAASKELKEKNKRAAEEDPLPVKPVVKKTRKSKKAANKVEVKDKDNIPNGLPNDVDVKGEVEDEI
ncbi:hypothetical protein BS50DRAFT_584668 [Corynespora cassiicola Philippines]|uniref:Myb-like domain-containing protein n=1 Tax=Corynespora cassiicola Philippines TaxID=1448308 RepID=A0A2T2P0E8_CORCC|nr:hypothetical protein BS50DRAFT_584668 [Corynespora cassiicola Philippines]